MKRTMTTSQVAHELHADESGGWSWAGALAMAEYLEEYETDTGEEMELDVVAIRCDFSEYECALEAAMEYGFEPDEAEEGEDLDDTRERHEGEALEWLQERTQAIPFEGGVIVQGF